MRKADVAKIQELQRSLDTVNDVLDTLKDEKLRLCNSRRRLSEEWNSEAAAIYLSKLDDRIKELSDCISSVENICNKIKNHINSQTKILRNQNIM